MPKKRTARQREAQRRAHAAEQRLARDEQEREAYVRLAVDRSGDPRFAQRVALPEGGSVLTWDADTAEGRMIREALEANRQAFREKFGRDPGPHDPVFFDPDADEPVPLSPENWQAGFARLRQAAEDAGVDTAHIAAWQEVGYVVTEENQHLFTAAEVQAYLDAVERHQRPAVPDQALPADLFTVELAVRHRRAWSVEPGDELEVWDVSADAYGEDGSTIVSHVGDFCFVAFDLYKAKNPYDLLARDGDDLLKIAKVIFDRRSGELSAELDDSLEALGDRILVVRHVELAPAWRRFGVGSLLIASALDMLSGGVRAVVCHPVPIDDPGVPAAARDQSARRKRSAEAVRKVFFRVGFEEFRDGVWVLDLNLTTFEQCLTRLREEAQRYERA